MIAGFTRAERQLALLVMVALAVCGLAMAATAGEEAFGAHGAIILFAAVASQPVLSAQGSARLRQT